MHVAEFLVEALAAYGLAGAVFAIAFVTLGIQRVGWFTWRMRCSRQCHRT